MSIKMIVKSLTYIRFLPFSADNLSRKSSKSATNNNNTSSVRFERSPILDLVTSDGIIEKWRWFLSEIHLLSETTNLVQKTPLFLWFVCVVSCLLPWSYFVTLLFCIWTWSYFWVNPLINRVYKPNITKSIKYCKSNQVDIYLHVRIICCSCNQDITTLYTLYSQCHVFLIRIIVSVQFIFKVFCLEFTFNFLICTCLT